MAERILLIEDEKGLQMSIEDNLKNEGFEVTIRGEGISGMEEALKGDWDLMLLDIMLPGKDGFEICREVRRKNITSPIIMLTARTLTMDKVHGLDSGADDYISKPFELAELLARIKAGLRRGKLREDHAPEFFKFGEFELDRKTAVLTRKKKKISLHTREYLLLKYLTENVNRVIHRNELLDQVWGYDSVTTTRTVDVHIAGLRKKLGDSDENRHILTVRGLGYRFIREPEKEKTPV